MGRPRHSGGSRRPGKRWRPGQMRVVGIALIALGLGLLFLCVPGWAWSALIGAALVVTGWLLIR